MKGRQPSRFRSLVRNARTVRAASTATAVKPAPQAPGKWGRPDSSESNGEPTSRLIPNLGKWAKAAPAATSTHQHQAGDLKEASLSYRPNTGKWAKEVDPGSSRRSILGDLDVSSSSSIRRAGERNGPQTRTSATSRKAAQSPTVSFPQWPARDEAKVTSSQEGNSGRDEAPHLAAKRNASGIQEKRPPFTVSDSREKSPPDPENHIEVTSKSEGRSNSLSPEFLQDYISESGIGNEGGRNRHLQRGAFKDRGSLVERLGAGESIEIPNHSRTGPSEGTRKIKKRSKEVKSVSLDTAIPSIISVGNLARLLGVPLETLQTCMQRNDMGEQSSHDHMLTADDASLLATEFNRNPIIDDESAFDIYASPIHPDQASLPRRPPVVTIMGHVDHGKTTLLDKLRSSSVAKGEAGGITQHIGAFSVPIPSAMNSPDIPHSITFLDTPGHAAFSQMRIRGAKVTDIVVLVVAADDGVMPQTKEVINLIKKDKDNIGVVVAINKVDKPGADVENVQNALWAAGVELETMGGDVPSVEVSGLTGHGLDELVETISLLAELQDIRAETDGPAHGYILESKIIKGLGNTATVLLLRGKLAPSSHIISGTAYAKVRHMKDSFGSTVKAAGPGSAVVVSGWKDLPSAGDEVLQGKPGDIKRAVENRRRKLELESTLTDAEAINASRRQERERKAQEASEESLQMVTPVDPTNIGPKELRLVIKGDVSGSIEALSGAVQGIGNKLVITKVVSASVGEVTESDVMRARAAEGMIIAFSVNVPRMAEQAASQNDVPIYSSNVIYSVLDEVKERAIKLLPPTVERRVTGEANVLQIFDISGKAKSIINVAGCRVSNGVVEKEKQVRVLRDGKIVHEGTLSTLRIMKRDVMEVKKGLECGISVDNFSDLRAGDFLQFYQEIERPGQL